LKTEFTRLNIHKVPYFEVTIFLTKNFHTKIFVKIVFYIKIGNVSYKLAISIFKESIKNLFSSLKKNYMKTENYTNSDMLRVTFPDMLRDRKKSPMFFQPLARIVFFFVTVTFYGSQAKSKTL